jgi:ribosomal protein L6P/L9E
MNLVKVVNLKDKITINISRINKNVFFYFKGKKKLVLKISYSGGFFLKNNALLILNNLTYSDYIKQMKLIEGNLERFLYSQYTCFGKLYMIGLGFKNFILGNVLYVLVGDCNYIMFVIPANLKVFCKKNQIYILGESNVEIFNFMSNIKRVKKSNFYKGKGLLQFKNFKFTKLKVGKKQRFM